MRVVGDGRLLLSLGFSSARHNCWIHLAKLPPLGDPALCLESELHFEAQYFELALYRNNWVCLFVYNHLWGLSASLSPLNLCLLQ